MDVVPTGISVVYQNVDFRPLGPSSFSTSGGESFTLEAQEGRPSFLWGVTYGSEYITLAATETSVPMNTVVASSQACGDPSNPARIVVTDDCGSTCSFTITPEDVCCPPEIPLEWDYENSSDTIIQSGNATVYVIGGADSDFTWTVSGQGFTFSNNQTTIIGGRSQIIYADETSCGEAEITCTDYCDDSVNYSLRNIDSGYWEEICSSPFGNGGNCDQTFTGPADLSNMPATTYFWLLYQNGNYRYVDIEYGGYKDQLFLHHVNSDSTIHCNNPPGVECTSAEEEDYAANNNNNIDDYWTKKSNWEFLGLQSGLCAEAVNFQSMRLCPGTDLYYLHFACDNVNRITAVADSSFWYCRYYYAAISKRFKWSCP